MRVLISGGGTAGHINPAIAIAKYFCKKDSNTKILFVGTANGMEQRLVPKEGFDIVNIDVSGIKRSLTPENLKIILKAVKSVGDSKKIISDFKPDIVIGTGGYVCGPVLLAASKMKIPTIIHEQNVPPGMVVNMLTSRVDITAISFTDTKKLLKKPRRVELTGNPIRESILSIGEKHDEKPLVMISGGSLGAKKINDALMELLSLPGQEYYNICASVGERYYEGFVKEMHENGITNSEGKEILPYIHNMDDILSRSSLAVTRAGAITVSELCAIGKPAIVIPSPNVVHDHQTINARFMEKMGAAVVITEDKLSGKKLAEEIFSLLKNKEQLSKMSEAGKKIGITDATAAIYGLAQELTA